MDPLLSKSSLLYDVVILRKKIHKIFDLMKCDKKEDIVKNTLGKHHYFVLKETLFSLKDISLVNTGEFFHVMLNYFKAFEDHILNNCDVCKYEGGNCMGCLSKEILMVYNIE